MAKKPNENEILYCSFCGKSQHEVLKLIAGPNVQICNCCTDLCIDIVLEEIQEAGELKDLKDMPRLSSLIQDGLKDMPRLSSLVQEAQDKDSQPESSD